MSPPIPYSRERLVAELAVRRATLYTQKIFHNHTKSAVTKDDKSPVTIADFGAQALIIAAIRFYFPEDQIVGEEEASVLRSNFELRSQIWDLVSDIGLPDQEEDLQLGGPLKNEEQMLDAIDAGNSPGGDKGRIWALDPVDGTLGFLRGGQYAVCLALIEDGEVVVGVLGCPNLPIDGTAPMVSSVSGNEGQSDEQRGVLFSAVIGQGASARPLVGDSTTKAQPITMRKVTSLSEATFCESVEAKHSAHEQQDAIAKLLGMTAPSVRMDSQAKYGSLARGAGDIYLRLPRSLEYQEKIWDHAAGDLILREAGGEVTDIKGQRLNFGKGRTLVDNKGIVAAPKDIHGKVLEAVQTVLNS